MARRLIVCGDCGEEKPLYAKGLCTPCYKRKHYMANQERYRALNKAWKKEHPGYMARYMRAYKELYPDYQRRYYDEEHREEKRAYMQAWEKAHREERRAYGQRRRRENPEMFRAYDREYRARKRGLPNTLTCEEAGRLRVIGEAVYPGEELHLDHIVPLSKGGGTTRANMHAIPASLNYRKSNKLPEEIYRQVQIWQNPMVEKRALKVM